MAIYYNLLIDVFLFKGEDNKEGLAADRVNTHGVSSGIIIK
jgi:hypothetical protein